MMGVGFRVFLVDEDSTTLVRIPMTQFDRLQNSDPDERLSEYAGKRVRYALVTLEVKARKPVSIIRIDYGYLKFNKSGFVDKRFLEEEARAAMETLAFNQIENKPRNVIDARDQFAMRRYKNEFTWSPSLRIEKAIYHVIFEL